jgi:Fe2+ transport system protein B
MKDNIQHIFQVPDDGMENAKKKILMKLEVIRELHNFPLLKNIKESDSNCYDTPHNYFVTAKLEINQKINSKDLKAKNLSLNNSTSKKPLFVHLYVKRVAAFLILTLVAWFVFKFLLNKQNNAPKEISEITYVDTCKTLACIERETILNELYYEASEDEMEILN